MSAFENSSLLTEKVKHETDIDININLSGVNKAVVAIAKSIEVFKNAFPIQNTKTASVYDALGLERTAEMMQSEKRKFHRCIFKKICCSRIYLYQRW